MLDLKKCSDSIGIDMTKIPYFNTGFCRPEDGRRRTDDCSVRAFMVLTDLSYLEAETLLSMECGYTPKGGGVCVSDFVEARLGRIGKRVFRPEYSCFKSPTNLTLGRFVKEHPVGKFLVTIHRHALAVVDGEVWDCITPRPRCYIKMAWEVITYADLRRERIQDAMLTTGLGEP